MSYLFFKSMLISNSIKKKKKCKSNKMRKTALSCDMCRICFKVKGDIPIFNNIVHPNIPEEINHFSGVKVDSGDNLPKTMCQDCLNLLNECIRFRDMCQNTNKTIIELVVKKESEESLSKEPPSEDAVFDDDYKDSDYAPSQEPTKFYLWCSKCCKDYKNKKLFRTHKCIAIKKQCADSNTECIKKSFLCDVCGKTANSKASLMSHMTTHENVFPFKCDLCSYKGRTQDLLKVHKRVHMAEKPYKCTQCPKTTTSASNLKKHMTYMHTSDKPFKCDFCDRAFPYRHDVTRHIREIHLRQTTAECDICFKTFNTRKNLRGHRIKVHKIKSMRSGRLPSYLQCKLNGDESGDTRELQCKPDGQAPVSNTEQIISTKYYINSTELIRAASSENSQHTTLAPLAARVDQK